VERYFLGLDSDLLRAEKTYSIYGNVVLGLTDSTELSAGVRMLRSRRQAVNAFALADSFLAAFPNPGGASQLPCAATGIPGATDSPVYPGICDIALPGGPAPPSGFDDTSKPVVYNLMLSQRLSPDFLIYASLARGWRGILPSIGPTGLPDSVLFPYPERATSFEIGAKASGGRWLQFGANLFQIDFDGQYLQFQSIPYFNFLTGAIAATGSDFFYNIDSRVRGAELDLSVRPLSNLSLDASLSYSKVTAHGGDAPCRNDAIPLSLANPINFCRLDKGETLNAGAPFQASLRAAYSVPIGRQRGYVRLLVNHQGGNPNIGVSQTRAKAHRLVNLFAGLSAREGAWDLGFFAKNLFDVKIETTSNEIAAPFGLAPLLGSTGFSQVRTTPPREMGVTLRFAFGSR